MNNLFFSNKNIILLDFFLFFVFFNISFSSTYYVSSTKGNDNNPGTSTLPWANCPGMVEWTGSATLSPGDTVLFNSADIWTVSTGAFVLNITGGVTYIGDSWGNGTRAIFSTQGNLTSSVVQFYDDDIIFETICKGFEINANGKVTNGIGINYPGWSIQNSPLTGATKRIENCIVHDVWSEVNQGQYKYGIIVSNWGGSSAKVKNVEIIDCLVYNVSRSSINLYPADRDSSHSIGNIIVRGCESHTTALDPGYDAGSGLTIKNHVYYVVAEFNYFHDIGGGTGSNGILINADSGLNGSVGPDNITLRYNILRNTGNDGIHIRQYGDKDLKIIGNIIYPNSGTSAIKVDGSVKDDLNLLIYNNTIYDEGIYIGNISATINSLEVKNNIFHATSSHIPLYDANGGITSHSSNIYYREGGGTVVYSNGSNFTESNITNYEITASGIDPQLINVLSPPSGFYGLYNVNMRPNTEGLNITLNSPAKDNGATLDDSYNGSINSVTRPIGNAWDIGAYEFIEEDNIAPSPPKNLRVIQ